MNTNYSKTIDSKVGLDFIEFTKQVKKNLNPFRVDRSIFSNQTYTADNIAYLSKKLSSKKLIQSQSNYDLFCRYSAVAQYIIYSRKTVALRFPETPNDFDIILLTSQIAANDRVLDRFDVSKLSAYHRILEVMVYKYPDCLIKNLDKFNIRIEEQMVDLAELFLKKNVSSMGKFIAKCSQLSADSTLEYLLKALESNVPGHSEIIKTFPEIVDRISEADWFEFVKNVALLHPNLIPQYACLSKEKLKELAEFMSQEFVDEVSKNFKFFHIDDPQLCLKYAFMAAKEELSEFFEHFEEFQISDPVEVERLIQIRANYCPLEVISFLQAYPIKKERREAAFTCAMIKGKYTAKYIDVFNIKDPETFFQIALECAKSKGKDAAKYFEHFRLKDPHKIFLFAKECVQDGALEAYQNLMKKNLKLSENEKNELLRIAFARASDPYAIFKFIVYNFPRNIKEFLALAISIQPEVLDHCYNTSFNELYKIFTRENAIPLISSLTLNYRFSPIYNETVFNKIADEENIDLRNQLILWLIVSSEFTANLPSPGSEMRSAFSQLMRDIFAIQDMPLRYRLSEILALTFSKESSQLLFMEDPVLYKLYPSFLAAGEGAEQTSWEKIRSNLARIKRNFRDASFLSSYLRFMDSIAFNNSLSITDKENLIGRLLEEEKMKSAFLNCSLLIGQGLDAFFTKKYLDESGMPLNQIILLVFKKVMPITDEGFLIQIEEKFTAQLRGHPLALFQYAGCLHHIPRQERKPSLKALAAYFESVINGTYKELRMDLNRNRHLEKLFGLYPDLKEKWASATPLKCYLVDRSSHSEQKTGYLKKFIENYVVNDLNHINEANSSWIRSYSLASVESRKDVWKQLSHAISDAGKLKNSKKLQSLTFQKKLLRLLIEENLGKLSPQALMDKLENIAKEAAKLNEEEFSRNLKDLQKTLKETGKNKSVQVDDYVIDTDDPYDLALCGTEVDWSCQVVTGKPALNKCLLAYLLDGKIRMIAVKNRDGKILSRAMMRLLLNERDEPVIVIERFYPLFISLAHNEAILNLAKAKAKSMGLPLLGIAYEGDPYPMAVKSFGGPVPNEYVDSGYGIKKNGIYTISGLKKIA